MYLKSNYFAHDRVALHGFSKMFEHSWKEETEHAEKFIDYSIKRGGRVITPTISVSILESRLDSNDLDSLFDLVELTGARE